MQSFMKYVSSWNYCGADEITNKAADMWDSSRVRPVCKQRETHQESRYHHEFLREKDSNI